MNAIFSLPTILFLLGSTLLPLDAGYTYGLVDDSNNSNKKNDDEISMGTTLVAIRHASGVVVGADSRTSVSGYVSHRFAHKISPLLIGDGKDGNESSIVVLRSGSAADTQHLAHVTAATLTARRYRYSHWIPTVQQSAHFLRSQVHDKGDQMTVSLLVAGYDAIGGGQIFSISPSGALLEEGWFAASGSGSTYVLGFLDQQIAALLHESKGKESSLSEEDAVELCHQALELAMQRDGSSGGHATVYSITSNGQRKCQPPTESKEEPDYEDKSSDRHAVNLPGFARATVVNHKTGTI